MFYRVLIDIVWMLHQIYSDSMTSRTTHVTIRKYS